MVRHRNVPDPRAQRLDRLGVVGVMVRERDPAAPPRAATSAATASMWESIAGPGSTTHAGSRPTTHVFVPVRVSGLGLGARMRAWSVVTARNGRPARPARVA
jgi:hypothetical protein